MRRFLAIFLTTLALSLSLSAQEHLKPSVTTPSVAPLILQGTPETNGGWVRFTSEPGRFSVLMPEIPTDKSTTVQSKHGPYTTHLFIVREAKNVYLLGWVDYDPNYNFNSQSELEANRDNFVKGINATLTDTRSLTIDGYTAIEFTADSTDRTFMSRVYMVGRRPYQILISFPKGEAQLAPINRFFNSFKVRP